MYLSNTKLCCLVFVFAQLLFAVFSASTAQSLKQGGFLEFIKGKLKLTARLNSGASNLRNLTQGNSTLYQLCKTHTVSQKCVVIVSILSTARMLIQKLER